MADHAPNNANLKKSETNQQQNISRKKVAQSSE
jgi:hypothetical protein